MTAARRSKPPTCQAPPSSGVPALTGPAHGHRNHPAAPPGEWLARPLPCLQVTELAAQGALAPRMKRTYGPDVRHAVLGAGAVGGLLGGALARAGADVVLLMRAASLDRYPGTISVTSEVLGDFEVAVPAVPVLDREVDVVWVTPKATQLNAALALAPADVVKPALVIPLLNGVDHMAVLRAHYDRVLAGSIRVASVRGEDGQILQTSPFIRMELAGDGADAVVVEVSTAGIDCQVGQDETSLLWQKLAFLAPLALATTAADAPLGHIRHDPLYLRAQDEVLAVAQAQGADIDLVALAALRVDAPDTMGSSMQHDVAQGRVPELDAIAGPVLRGGREHAIATPAVEELVARVKARALPAAEQDHGHSAARAAGEDS